MAAGRRTRVRRRLRRWVANPIASVVLVGVLIGDSLTLPRNSRPTVIGRQVRHVLEYLSGQKWTPGSSDPPWTDVYWVADPDGIQIIYPAVESWGPISDLISADALPIAECSPYDLAHRSGFWAPTVTHYSRGISVSPLTGEWSDNDLTSVRLALVVESRQFPAAWELVEHWSDVAVVDRSWRQILWGGVAHNALALTVFAALLYSFTGWPAWIAQRPWSVRSRRLDRGLCLSCGYDLRGLGGTICPECGGTSVIPPSKL
jgi:hypothetical protein